MTCQNTLFCLQINVVITLIITLNYDIKLRANSERLRLKTWWINYVCNLHAVIALPKQLTFDFVEFFLKLPVSLSCVRHSQ